MSGEKSGKESQVIATFEVKIRPGANAEEALALQQRLHDIARNTDSIGEIKGRTGVIEDGVLLTVYTFKSKEAMQIFVRHPDHVEAMRRGKEFFSSVRTQIATLDKQNEVCFDS